MQYSSFVCLIARIDSSDMQFSYLFIVKAQRTFNISTLSMNVSMKVQKCFSINWYLSTICRLYRSSAEGLLSRLFGTGSFISNQIDLISVKT